MRSTRLYGSVRAYSARRPPLGDKYGSILSAWLDIDSDRSGRIELDEMQEARGERGGERAQLAADSLLLAAERLRFVCV